MINLVKYCDWLSRKNNLVLYKLELYLGKNMTEIEDLKEIRKIILDVSGDIKRIPQYIAGDKNE